MTEVEKPHVTRVGPTPRSATMPGLGNSKAAQDAVFEDLEPGRLANKVFEADGGYVVVQLIARSKPNIADFDKDADQRVAELRAHRANAFLTEWLKGRCETLVKDGKILPNPELIAEHDDQGRLLPSQYRPCISFHGGKFRACSRGLPVHAGCRSRSTPRRVLDGSCSPSRTSVPCASRSSSSRSPTSAPIRATRRPSGSSAGARGCAACR
jgi:hypothetical protein